MFDKDRQDLGCGSSKTRLKSRLRDVEASWLFSYTEETLTRYSLYILIRIYIYIPDRMSEYMSDKLSQYISGNVMVGITRSILFFVFKDPTINFELRAFPKSV